jgi:hypothetical protein
LSAYAYQEASSLVLAYEPIPESEFERAIEALRAVLAFAEEIRRGAPALVIE